LDNPTHIELVTSTGSISSNQVSRVFAAQVQLTTSGNHQVLASALLDSGVNSCFMDRDFAATQEIILYKLPRLAAVAVIDGRSIASGDIVEESELIRIVLGNLACTISFNIISSLEYLIVLGLPWFELHNPNIDWRKREIKESRVITQHHSPRLLVTTTSNLKPKQVSTISLQRLYQEGREEDIFVLMDLF
jgi:hypothetical protein